MNDFKKFKDFNRNEINFKIIANDEFDPDSIKITLSCNENLNGAGVLRIGKFHWDYACNIEKLKNILSHDSEVEIRKEINEAIKEFDDKNKDEYVNEINKHLVNEAEKMINEF